VSFGPLLRKRLVFRHPSRQTTRVGTIRYVTDANDADNHVAFHDHEGYVQFHLARPVTDNALPAPSTWEGWVSTWTVAIEAVRDRVRAACECGWHGVELPWVPGEPDTEEQQEAIMLAWDRHIEDDVIRGLAWSECAECGDPFVVEGTGRPRLYCSAAHRQSAYRARC
jgi:hypothetical protein